jgi:hypothetical protein
VLHRGTRVAKVTFAAHRRFRSRYLGGWRRYVGFLLDTRRGGFEGSRWNYEIRFKRRGRCCEVINFGAVWRGQTRRLYGGRGQLGRFACTARGIRGTGQGSGWPFFTDDSRTLPAPVWIRTLLPRTRRQHDGGARHARNWHRPGRVPIECDMEDGDASRAAGHEDHAP